MATSLLASSRQNLRLYLQRHPSYAITFPKTHPARSYLTFGSRRNHWKHDPYPCPFSLPPSNSKTGHDLTHRAWAHWESSGRAEAEHWHKGRLGLFLGWLVLLAMPITCGGLGFWQIQRLKWKEEMIEDIHDKLQRAPIVLPRNVKYVVY